MSAPRWEGAQECEKRSSSNALRGAEKRWAEGAVGAAGREVGAVEP